MSEYQPNSHKSKAEQKNAPEERKVKKVVSGKAKTKKNEVRRLTDIFLSVPAMLLALAVASLLKPNLTNAMIAVTIMWWPWYCRLVYGSATSCRQENFVIGADLMGASKLHIVFKEIQIGRASCRERV